MRAWPLPFFVKSNYSAFEAVTHRLWGFVTSIIAVFADRQNCILDLWSGSLCYTTGFTAKITGIDYYRFTNSPITKFKIKRGRTAREFSLEEPDIIFSEWYSWDDVKNIPNGHRTGLYIIARFDEKPNGPARPDVKEIIYIGETHGKSQCISKRLQKFFKAAHVGEKIYKHSGGNRFNRTIGKDLSNMYAAGFAPILDNAEAINPFIFYAERKLIWAYVQKFGHIPVCNGY